MKVLHKKLVSVLLICLMLIVGAVTVSRYNGSHTSFGEEASSTESVQEQTAGASQKETDDALDAAYQSAATDAVFWYEDDSYGDYFETAAIQYFSRTGKKIAVQCRDTMDYIGDIYDETMQDGAYPDVYLISGQDLEEAYLYGLVSVNEIDADDLPVLEQAKRAATYEDKLLGYPLSYDVCVFIYQNGYFEEEPQSLQSIIDYSNDNEPGEDVEYLLEWNVNDAFFDFPFVSNSISFEKSELGHTDVTYDEDLYAQDLEYFEQILESFSVNAETVSEEEILGNFLTGRTLCAIVDSDMLHELDGYDYSLMQIPDLNDELAASTCALTDMIVVNDYSKNQKVAADFARFVTEDMADELYDMTGHMSVVSQDTGSAAEQVARAAYENSVLAPDSQDAKDFWVKLEETISKYF